MQGIHKINSKSANIAILRALVHTYYKNKGDTYEAMEWSVSVCVVSGSIIQMQSWVQKMIGRHWCVQGFDLMRNYT